MNDLTLPQKTMSSVEIAELTGKEHRNVMADIRKVLNELELNAADFSASQTYGNNNTRQVFNLPKRECTILVSGYNIKMRAAIIDRWQELEQKQPDPMLALNDPAIMRGLLLNYSEKVLELEQANAEMAPKVEALDRIADSDGLICIRDAAKTLQIAERKFVKWLIQNDWIYRRPQNNKIAAYSQTLKADLMEHKAVTRDTAYGERTYTQAMITPKGLTKLSAIFCQTEMELKEAAA